MSGTDAHTTVTLHYCFFFLMIRRPPRSTPFPTRRSSDLLVLEVEGKAPVTLNAGDYFFVPAGIVHDGRNVGSGKAKVLATYIVEKGKPIATPVKRKDS